LPQILAEGIGWGEIHLILESNQLGSSTNYHHTNKELGIFFLFKHSPWSYICYITD
jgi:hypothetical protein